jgi:DNA polymerase-3 subunit delta'
MHPRDTYAMVGHEAAESELAEALASGCMHHAWLITGPEGVGKTTLAFRVARAALKARITGPRLLDVSASDPVARRIAAGSHADFFLLERTLNERGKKRRDIPAEAARGLATFFTLQSAEAGMRVAIIDAVDDLNRFGANALLKILEEPPPHALIMLLCHAPGAAPATLRSRCRRLALRPLSNAEVAQIVDADEATLRLAAGRPGRAFAMKRDTGLAHAIAAALERLERQDGRGLAELAFMAGGDREERLKLVLDACEDWLRRAATKPDIPLGRAGALASAYARLEILRAEAFDLDLDPTHALARAAGIVSRAIGREPVA